MTVAERDPDIAPRRPTDSVMSRAIVTDVMELVEQRVLREREFHREVLAEVLADLERDIADSREALEGLTCIGITY
jgi:hypothetical protein